MSGSVGWIELVEFGTDGLCVEAGLLHDRQRFQVRDSNEVPGVPATGFFEDP